MRTMKAAVFRGDGILDVEDRPIPAIGKDDQVLLEVKAASICGSDIHGLLVPPAQYITPDIIMGHEFFGEVLECGKGVNGFSVGDIVAVNPAIPCGRCFECSHGRPDICDHNIHYGQNCDGGFAEYVLVKSSQLYRLPEGIDADTAAQIEPLACIMGGLAKLKPGPGEYILLYGAGPIGLMFVKVLRAMGIEHIAVCAKGKKRIEEARRFGAESVIDIQEETVEEKLTEIWGRCPDVIIDAVGTGNIMEEAVKLLVGGGRMLLFGFNKRAMSRIPPAVFCVRELQVMGTRRKDFPAALEILQKEKLCLKDLVSHRFPLSDIKQGLELMRNKQAARVIIYP